VRLPASSQLFSVDVYPWFTNTKGNWSVVEKRLFSPQLNNYRGIVVYTPPSYSENTVAVYKNVLIMHDGQNLFDPATSAFGTAWMCQDTMNALIQSGGSAEVVIIGVYNTPDRTNELTYSYDQSTRAGGKGDHYLDFLHQTVLPWAARLFRIETNRENLGILGSSLGGIISCYGAWRRPDQYTKMGCMSSAFWWNDEDFDNVILANRTIPSPLPQVYLDSGDSGPSSDDRDQTIRVRDHFVKLGYTLGENLQYFLDRGGEHSEYFWAKRFFKPIQALYPVPTLFPKSAE